MTNERLAELLWSYEADEPHAHELRSGHYPSISWAEIYEYWLSPHEGDCTGLPATCIRCVADEIVFKARWIADQLALPCPAPNDDAPAGSTSGTTGAG